MLADAYCERISRDWMWRERDLRAMDAVLLKNRSSIVVKSAILIVYSHWEGHFKFCASQLLEYMAEGVRRKSFGWTDVAPEVRQRILFCSIRKANVAHQNHETFISYLNALTDNRYAGAMSAKEQVVMVDDNLSSARAEAICRNLGVDYSWFIMKKVIIDERLLNHRNAIAHGSSRLRSGDEMNFSDGSLVTMVDEIRGLIREAKNRFENAIVSNSFLS